MKHDILQTIRSAVGDPTFISAIYSSPLAASSEWGNKVSVIPLLAKGQKLFQFTLFKGTQTFHRNVASAEAPEVFIDCLNHFKQLQLFTGDADYHILQGSKGFTCIKKPPSRQANATPAAHNRAKKHPLPENQPDPFLIELGLMTQTGKLIASQTHKFRQINRFLELMEHGIEQVDPSTPLHIVDFGCGKAYLTFALYHYFRHVKGWNVSLEGVDRKEQVIRDCEALTKKLGYDGLNFTKGDIETFVPTKPVDIVVALHACNTATDLAIAHAVSWNSKYLFAAPCCQQELYQQVRNPALEPFLKHGILKERFAALLTDAVRALLLESVGYQAQIVEFIDMEHSPKNLLLRAVKKENVQRERAAEQYAVLKQEYGLEPTLERLLHHRGR
jgi:SAM-dependent methyltransferase